MASDDPEKKWHNLRKHMSKQELYGTSPSTIQALESLERLKSEHTHLFETLQEKGDQIFQEIVPQDPSKKLWGKLKFRFAMSFYDFRKDFKKIVVTYHGTCLSEHLNNLKETADKNLKLVEDDMQTLIQQMNQSYLTPLKQLRGQIYYFLESANRDTDTDLIPEEENPFPTENEFLSIKTENNKRIHILGNMIRKTGRDIYLLTN